MANPESIGDRYHKKPSFSGGFGRDVTVSLLRHTPADIVGFGDQNTFVARNRGITDDGSLSLEISPAINDYGYIKGDIVGFGDPGVFISVNNGDGTFKPIRKIIDDFGCSQGWNNQKHPRFMVDLTGDGYADILGFGVDGVRISRNQRDGTFGPSNLVLKNFGVQPEAGNWDVDKHIRRLADSNGNGLPDIYGFGNSGVWLSTNNILQCGTFKPPTKVHDSFGYDKGWRVDKHPRFVADLTGDGTGDIVGFGNQGVLVAMNDGNGSFSPLKKVLKVFGYNGGWRIEKHLRLVADVMGHGRGDIVAFGEEGVWLSVNNGDGSFSLPALVLDEFGCSYNAGGWEIEKHPRFLLDLTGDGKMDILGFGEKGVYISLNEGGGRFGPMQQVLSSFSNNDSWSADKHVRYPANIFTRH